MMWVMAQRQEHCSIKESILISSSKESHCPKYIVECQGYDILCNLHSGNVCQKARIVEVLSWDSIAMLVAG